MAQPQDPIAGTKPVPRHPSAGNLGSRPALVTREPEAESLPPESFPAGAEDGPELALGPALDPDLSARLLGSVDGKRVLELGAGTGRMAVALAAAGAKVITVDPSMERVADAREVAEQSGTKIEYHHGDYADLAFVRGDQIDLVVAAYSLATVDDLGRVFRQVNRVLRNEASFVLSLPHPLALMTSLADGTPRLVRTAFDRSTITWNVDGEAGVVHPHQLGDIVTTLWRSNFRVDTMLEPRPTIDGGPSPHWTPLGEWIPTSVLIRSRKQA